MEGSYDVILTPTMVAAPIRLGALDMMSDDLEKYIRDLFTYNPFNPQCNASGQPAVSLPLHWSKEGMPIGVQFAATFGSEALLLRLASQLEQARPWSSRWPPLVSQAS